jgi:hypothetical protein
LNVETLSSSGQLTRMLIEMLFNSVHSPPGCNYKFRTLQYEEPIEYTLDMFCTMITLLRFYQIFQYFANYSNWTNNEKSD